MVSAKKIRLPPGATLAVVRGSGGHLSVLSGRIIYLYLRPVLPSSIAVVTGECPVDMLGDQGGRRRTRKAQTLPE